MNVQPPVKDPPPLDHEVQLLQKRLGVLEGEVAAIREAMGRLEAKHDEFYGRVFRAP